MFFSSPITYASLLKLHLFFFFPCQLCKLLRLHEKARRLPQSALSDFERPHYEEESRRILKALEYPVITLPHTHQGSRLSARIKGKEERR
jgi:hypothetical protein